MKSKLKYLLIIVIIIVITFIIITKTNQTTNKDIVIFIGNEKVIIDYEKESNVIDLKSFTSEFDTIIKEKT